MGQVAAPGAPEAGANVRTLARRLERRVDFVLTLLQQVQADQPVLEGDHCGQDEMVGAA